MFQTVAQTRDTLKPVGYSTKKIVCGTERFLIVVN